VKKKIVALVTPKADTYKLLAMSLTGQVKSSPSAMIMGFYKGAKVSITSQGHKAHMLVFEYNEPNNMKLVFRLSTQDIKKGKVLINRADPLTLSSSILFGSNLWKQASNLLYDKFCAACKSSQANQKLYGGARDFLFNLIQEQNKIVDTSFMGLAIALADQLNKSEDRTILFHLGKRPHVEDFTVSMLHPVFTYSWKTQNTETLVSISLENERVFVFTRKALSEWKEVEDAHSIIQQLSDKFKSRTNSESGKNFIVASDLLNHILESRKSSQP